MSLTPHGAWTYKEREKGASTQVTEASYHLRVLAELGRSLATFTDLDDLVNYAARRTRELFQAEGCALLLLDRPRGEFYIPVANQGEMGIASAAQLAEIRFPASQGVAGWVLANDTAAVVPDTANEPRFFDGVDRRTAMHTRALLCAPLRTRSGNIGVIEVVNPAAAHLERDDLDFLDTLASEIGIAYEKAALYRAVEREVFDLRRFGLFVGLTLLVIGLLVAGGATFYHRARVLPWSQLLGERGFLIGLICLALGALFAAVGKGWIVAPRARRRPGGG